LDYLGRYTHRVAISNNRLLDMKEGQVTFAYKDYKHEQQQKSMTLAANEFLRRFLLHVLPDSFQRIRHYGLLGNRRVPTTAANQYSPVQSDNEVLNVVLIDRNRFHRH